jgi:integrase
MLADKKIIFLDFAPTALKELTAGVKQTTKQDIESRSRRLLIPFFGKLELNKISPLTIERWQSNLKISKGSDITRRTKQLLKNIFERAIVHNIININPVISTSKIRDDYRMEDREIYTKREVSIMLNNSEGWLKLFLLTFVSLGLRSGEIVSIKFSDIDWTNHRIHIQRNIKFGKFSLPKNNKKRWVDVPKGLMAEFNTAFNHRILKNPKQDYIFISEKNSHWSDSSSIIRRHLKPLLERIGVEYKGLYSLRHTYATLSLQGGQKIGYISKQLGHKNVKTTWDYYIKYLEDSEDKERGDSILSF